MNGYKAPAGHKSGQPYFFYLRKKTGNAYQYYAYDRTTKNYYLADSRTPIQDPPNWETLVLSWKRTTTAGGILKAQTLPVHFVGEAAKIINSLFLTYGRFAEAELYIEMIDTTDKTYDELFSAKLNFTKINTEPFGDGEAAAPGITIPVIENEVDRILTAYSTTKYNVPIDTHASVQDIYVHAVDTRTIYHYIGGETVQQSTTGSFFNAPNLNFSEALKEGDHDCILGKSVYAFFDTSLPVEQMNYQIQIFTALRPFTGVFSGLLNYYHSVPGSSSVNVKLQLRIVSYVDGDMNTVGINDVLAEMPTFTTVGGNQLGTMVINNKTYSFGKNDVVLLYFFGLGAAAGTVRHEFTIQSGWYLDINSVFQVEHSIFKALPYRAVVDDVAAAMGLTVQSNLLRTPTYYNDASVFYDYISSGKAISGHANLPLRLSYDDIKRDIWARYNAGVGVEGNKIVIEELSYFFKKEAVIFSLREADVKDFGYMPLDEASFSEIQIGYQEEKNRTKYDGQDEPNGTHIYTTQDVQSTEKQQWIAPFKAVMSQIENMRDNVGKTRALDNEPDENIFLVQTEPTRQVVTINGTSYSAYPVVKGGITAGVEFPHTQYNVPHSPKRMLRRKDTLIKSYLYNPGNAGQYVSFKSTGKNAKVYGKIKNGLTYIEYGDVNYTTVNDYLFKPFIIEFTVSSYRRDQIQAIKDSPYGVIRIETIKGNVDGFIMGVDIVTSRVGQATYRLLCSPNTSAEAMAYLMFR